MSRLTPKDWKDQSNEIWLKLGYIHMSDESYRSFLSQSLQKLAHYEDLEEAGRMIEIIRCKDCTRCWEDTIYNRLICEGHTVQPDDYCSYGELKELEGDHFTDVNKMGKE